MTSTYGGLDIPVQLPPEDGPAARLPVDRALDCIGGYLAATLNDRLGLMWSVVAPGMGQVVHRVFTANPRDVILNESHLPALFIWRQRHVFSKLTDDTRAATVTLSVLWLLEPGEPTQREKRLRMQGPVADMIDAALLESRDPAWVDFGETDADSLLLGSDLMARGGLLYQPLAIGSEEVPITIAVNNGDPVFYHAVSTQVQIVEAYKRDPATGTSRVDSDGNPIGISGGPSKVDIDATAGALELDSLIPTT